MPHSTGPPQAGQLSILCTSLIAPKFCRTFLYPSSLAPRLTPRGVFCDKLLIPPQTFGLHPQRGIPGETHHHALTKDFDCKFPVHQGP
jgi:hypothetical protein